MSRPEQAAGEQPAQILHLDHFAIRTTRMQETIAFYCDVLGLEAGPRPHLPVEGVWLYSGVTAIVHLVELPAAADAGHRDDSAGPPVSARHVDHVALRAIGYERMRERLRQAGVKVRESTVPSLNLRQLFFRDPNGIAIELNFRTASTAP